MNIVIATTTMYKSAQEPRFKLFLKTLKEINKLNYHFVIVDQSTQEVVDLFPQASENLTIISPFKDTTMGKSRRWAFAKALEQYEDENSIIVWMEPEKHTFVKFIKQIADYLTVENADLAIPRRKSVAYYPEFQQHNEALGNAFWEKATGLSLDMYFGPQIFRRAMAKYYLDYDGKYGDRWEAIQVPVVRMIADKRKICEITIDYRHPKEQKTEISLQMLEKRLFQLIKLSNATIAECKRLKIL